MQDDHGRTYRKRAAEKESEAFDEGMAVLSDMHKRELNAATIRAYFEIFEIARASEGRIRETFRRVREAERFFPSIAVMRAHLAAVPKESSRPVVEPTREIVYTPEEAADIARMKSDMDATSKRMPWYGVRY